MRDATTGKNWRFAVDRGGTFTDVIAVDPQGVTHSLKLLSVSDLYEDAVTEGVRRILAREPVKTEKSDEVFEVRLGTTVATNALLERKGEPVALVVTAGFEDAIEIGRQARPQLFTLAIKKPELLYRVSVGIQERIGADGTVITPLDRADTLEKLRGLWDDGFRCVAIVLVHAWINPEHEKIVARIAREIGFTQISASHEISRSIGFVGRGQTTLVDAYLNPVLRRYLRNVETCGVRRLLCMQNSGGLTVSEHFHGKDSILSGPAGGVVGCAAVARELGLGAVIGFDMGGTSTDVSRFAGEFENVEEVKLGGVEFQTSMLRVVTIAAGGGSVLRFDGHRFSVGPESAGAKPGPACYGRGGPLAITDANAVLGRVRAGFLPKTFGVREDEALHVADAERAFEHLGESVEKRSGFRSEASEIALGFVRIANEMMARPIKELTVSRGYDVREHALVAFGGAAGQHATGVADLLGIRAVVIPRNASLLSAWGIANARQQRTGLRSFLQPLPELDTTRLDEAFTELAAPHIDELRVLGIEDSITVDRILMLRTPGVDHSLDVEFGPLNEVRSRFVKAHHGHFGFDPRPGPIEIASIRVQVHGGSSNIVIDRDPDPRPSPRAGRNPESGGIVPVRFEGGWIDTPVIDRRSLEDGIVFSGPALIVEEHTTTVVEPGWSFHVRRDHLILERARVATTHAPTRRDPILLEVFNHLFMSVAEQMGAVLAATAHSANIRERLDFSCAIFDASGHLVANAPHIPVHLGAMGDTVRALAADRAATWRPGDVYITNHPYRGGSHLPDITLITPLFYEDVRTAEFFVASRGHHADIGGLTPGSFPPDATRLEEEGVVLDGVLAVRDGQFLEDEIRARLAAGPHPARQIDERISDLLAQIAANRRGERELRSLVEKYGLDVVRAYMDHIQDNASEAMEDALRGFVADRNVFESRFDDALDGGTRIVVRVRVERRDGDGETPVGACIDFTGTGDQHAGNLNAPIAVTRAAVLYVLRLLVRRDIPLNDGCWRPVDLIVPEGCVLNPRPGAAVVGGNVETSQRVVDVLLGALGVAAASQGTMNNLLFGAIDGSGRQYYETIAGGSGATREADGASAVQVHMTNTRITDVEVLEHRFPEVRVERFAIRRGSGGEGATRGGDGVVRALRFLAPRQVTIFSERRVLKPFGLEGGEPGSSGRNSLFRDNARSAWPGRISVGVEPGDIVEIETPGGGGFGPSAEKTI